MGVRVAVSSEEFEQFKIDLKNNKGTCPCSIDYNNEDEFCLCLDFRQNGICKCGIFCL